MTGIEDLVFDGCEILTISVHSGSYSETDAKENEIPFKAIEHSAQPTADINRDGIVNLKDAVCLRGFIAGGWNVTL